MEFQLAALHGPDQGILQLQVPAGPQLHLRVVDTIVVAGLLPGLAQRRLGVALQLLCAAAVGREMADAGAGEEAQRLAGDLERQTEMTENLLQQRQRVLVGDDHKVDAVAAGDESVFGKGGADPVGDLRQEQVPLVMAEGVVDCLKAVEAEHDQGEGAVLCGGGCSDLGQLAVEEEPVGQAGQGVDAGQVGDALFEKMIVAAVAKDQQHFGRGCFFRQGQGGKGNAAEFAAKANGQVGRRGASRRLAGGFQETVEGLAVFPRDEFGEGAAAKVRDLPAEKLGRGRIGPGDFSVSVGKDQGQGSGIEKSLEIHFFSCRVDFRRDRQTRPDPSRLVWQLSHRRRRRLPVVFPGPLG